MKGKLSSRKAREDSWPDLSTPGRRVKRHKESTARRLRLAQNFQFHYCCPRCILRLCPQSLTAARPCSHRNFRSRKAPSSHQFRLLVSRVPERLHRPLKATRLSEKLLLNVVSSTQTAGPQS